MSGYHAALQTDLQAPQQMPLPIADIVPGIALAIESVEAAARELPEILHVIARARATGDYQGLEAATLRLAHVLDDDLRSLARGVAKAATAARAAQEKKGK